MKTTVIVVVSVALIGSFGAAAQRQLEAQSGQPEQIRQGKVATLEQYDQWMTQLSNWGRWGKDDQLGTVNLITPARRAAALALAKTGTTVSLAHDLLTEKAVDAPNPYVLKMTVGADRPNALDTIEIDYHGLMFTHFDAVCHIPYKGKLYNGVDFAQNDTERGCATMGVTTLKDGIITRGILLDIPRLKGLPYLEPGTHVYREDIEAWEKQAGVKIGPGDAILLRTGRWARRAKLGPFSGGSGYDVSFLPFLKERDVAILGADSAHEVGSQVQGLPVPPIHRFAVAALGMPLLDNLDLEAAAETAARLKRWEFTLIIAPLRVPGGTGSPVNPLAVF